MTHILMLLSSPRGQASLSTRVASALADRLTSGPGTTLKIRDLAAEALPHIGPAYVVGRMLPRAQRTPVQAQAAMRAEALIDELKAADVREKTLARFGQRELARRALEQSHAKIAFE